MKNTFLIIFIGATLLLSIISVYQYKVIHNYKSVTFETQLRLLNEFHPSTIESSFNNILDNPNEKNVKSLYYQLNNIESLLWGLLTLNKNRITSRNLVTDKGYQIRGAADIWLYNQAENGQISEEEINKMKEMKDAWLSFLSHNKSNFRGERIHDANLLADTYSDLVRDIQNIFDK